MIHKKNTIWLLLFLSLHLSSRCFPVSYWIFFGAFMLISLSIFHQKDCRLNKSIWIAVPGLLFLSLIVRLLFQGNIYGTLTIYFLLAYCLLFFIWIILFNEDKSRIKTIAGIVILTVVIEIVWGFAQLFGFIANNNNYFILGGSFGNPNAYAGFLSVVAPLILSLLLTYRRNKRTEKSYYFLMALLLIAYILFISKSRGSLLAASLGCLIVTAYHYNLIAKIKRFLYTPARKIVAVSLVLLVVCISGYALYQWKADSAFGRVLVWKVTATTPHDNLLWGNGIGSFEANYGKWQAAYFAAGKGTEAERHVADYVTCAYNEFLEMAIDQGVIITILFIIVLLYAFSRKTKRTSSLFVGAKASLAAVTVLMMVSYPLSIPAVYLYFIFCLAVIYSEKKTYISSKIIKYCICSLGLAIAVFGGWNLHGYFLLQKGQKQVFSRQLDKGVETYQKAEAILKNNGLLYFYYASALFQKQEYQNSAEKLELAVNKSSNPNAFILLATNYKELGQPAKAKENYLVAINMIPSKLYPKYLLTKLLIDSQEYEEAEKWANEILNTKEKTPTTAAKEIKQEMENFLNYLPMETE